MRTAAILIQHAACAPDQARRAQRKSAAPTRPSVRLTLILEGANEALVAELVHQLTRISVSGQKYDPMRPYGDLPQPNIP